MKKIITILALTMLAMRSPAPVGVPIPIVAIVYYPTNNTVTVTSSGAQPKRFITLQMSTDLSSTNWTNLSSNAVPNNGLNVWTNIPATNSYTFFQTVY